MEQISWQMYVMSVGLVTGAYYLYVGFSYYRQDFKNIISRVLKPPDRQSITQEVEVDSIQEAELEALNQASQALETVFDELAGIQVTKQEAISVVRDQLSGFTDLRQRAVRQSLEGLVARKAREAFEVELTAIDLKAIWE
jgi:hypothetical protein